MENKHQKILVLILYVFFSLCSFSQSDSTTLPEVEVNAYLGSRPILRIPASTALIDSAGLKNNHGQSLVPVMNTVPGVRMEERSPGSYRLSIRGSLLRSPFGVRNLKIYLDEFAFTNASGETYLNLVDLNSINSVEVLKGPDGSLFGANSGGVVRLNPFSVNPGRSFLTIGLAGGSFGYLQQHFKVQQQIKKHQVIFNEGIQQSDGYRENSAMSRRFILLSDRFRYSDKSELKILFFYSNLHYQTPGGLTKQQFDVKPHQARPGTAFAPGASEQEAAIKNRTMYGGVNNQLQLTKIFKHSLSLFGSQTEFENPFITNYETRKEKNIGARTWLEGLWDLSGVKLTANLGAEAQMMTSDISNHENNGGQKGQLFAGDKVKSTQAFVFGRINIDLLNKVVIEASASYNYNVYAISPKTLTAANEGNIIFPKQLMPRVAASYFILSSLSLRAIVSKGYSVPTLQEVRASNNKINYTLDPETGWNYEAGFRFRSKNDLIWCDVSAFYYLVENAIVRYPDVSQEEFFINSGGTEQKGIEAQVTARLIKKRSGKFIRELTLSNSYTKNDFRFMSLTLNSSLLTGVPKQVNVISLNVAFPLNLFLNSQYNYTSSIPLNDLNTEFANEYHLLQARCGWRFQRKKLSGEISIGADNLLNEKYSLGNDLNAFGGRYYNAAPGRNYFARLVVSY